MDISLPVVLFDVTTTDAPPMVIVTCCTEQDALDLATRLNALARDGRLVGATAFTVAERAATKDLVIADGESVTVQGYQLPFDTVAQALLDADPGTYDPSTKKGVISPAPISSITVP